MRKHLAIPVSMTAALLVCSTFQGCSQSDGLEYVNSAVWTRAYDAEIQDGYAYCSFLNGLGILDVTSKDNPQLVSQLFLGGGFGPRRYQWVAHFAQGRLLQWTAVCTDRP